MLRFALRRLDLRLHVDRGRVGEEGDGGVADLVEPAVGQAGGPLVRLVRRGRPPEPLLVQLHPVVLRRRVGGVGQERDLAGDGRVAGEVGDHGHVVHVRSLRAQEGPAHRGQGLAARAVRVRSRAPVGPRGRSAASGRTTPRRGLRKAG